MKDLYKILGIDRNATQPQIRTAYKTKARECHPDKPGGTDEAFQDLNQAYSILRDPAQRKRYDASENVTQAKPSNEQEAKGRLAGLFNSTIGADESVDIISAIKDSMAQSLRDIKSKNKQAEDKIDNCKKTLNRIKYTGSSGNLFEGQINQNIVQLEAMISNFDREVDIAGIIVDMLDDYTCETKEENKEALYSATEHQGFFTSQHHSWP